MRPAWLKPARRWSVRLLKSAGVLVALVLAFQVLLLPWIVRRAVVWSFEGLGLEPVRFEVRGASLWNTDLAQVVVGPTGSAKVGSVSVDYSPASLLQGRVHALRLNGAEVVASLKDGRLDFAPLTLKRSDSPRQLPFDRLELRASTLVLVWEGRRLWVPVEAAVVNGGNGTMRLEAVARIQGSPVRVSGTVAQAGEQVDLAIEASGMEAPALAAGVPARYAAKTPSVSAGTIDLNARYVRRPEGGGLELRTAARGLRLGTTVGEHRVWVQDLEFAAAAKLDGGWNLVDVNAAAGARRVSFDGERAETVALKLDKDGERLAVNVSARGEDWQLRKLEAAVGGLFGGPSPPRYAVDLAIGADAEVPRQVARLLQARRLDVSALGAVSAEGRIAATIAPAPDGSWAWEAQTDQLQVLLSPGDLSINKDAVVLRGLSGVMRLSARADRRQATIRVMPGSNLWLGSLEQKGAPVKLEKGAADAALAAVAVDATPASLVLRFDGTGEPWELDAPAASVTVPKLELGGEGFAVRGLVATVLLQAQASPARSQVRFREGSALGFDSARLGAGGEALVAGPWKLGLSGRGDEPLLTVSETETGGLPRVAFQAEAQGPLTLSGMGVEAAVGRVSMGGKARLNDSGQPVIEAVLAVQDASGAHKAADVRVEGLSARVPIRWNAGLAEGGVLAAESVRIRGGSYPGPKGALGLTNTRASAELSWPVLNDLAQVNAAGWVELGAREPYGELSASIPQFLLSDETVLPTRVPELKDLKISGAFAGKAAMSFHGDRIKPLVSLTVKDVNVASKEYERSAEGITGTISIDSFKPLSTPGGQKLSVKRATSGKLAFTDGVLDFRIEPTSAIHVEGTEWNWAGGRLYASSFRFDADRPAIELAVSGTKLSLAEILSMIGERQFTGEGTLYGRLPVKLSWPQVKKGGRTVTQWAEPAIEFGEGFVYATPGGGHLRMANPEEVVGDLLEKQNPEFARGGRMEAVKSSLMGALRDLKYSILMMDFIKEQGELVAKLHVAGMGVNQQEIGGLTVNIRGFDAILRRIISIRRELSFGE